MTSEKELIETVFLNVQRFRVADTFGALEVLKGLLPDIMQPSAGPTRIETGNAISRLIATTEQTPRGDIEAAWHDAMNCVKAWKEIVSQS